MLSLKFAVKPIIYTYSELILTVHVCVKLFSNILRGVEFVFHPQITNIANYALYSTLKLFIHMFTGKYAANIASINLVSRDCGHDGHSSMILSIQSHRIILISFNILTYLFWFTCQVLIYFNKLLKLFVLIIVVNVELHWLIHLIVYCLTVT